MKARSKSNGPVLEYLPEAIVLFIEDIQVLSLAVMQITYAQCFRHLLPLPLLSVDPAPITNTSLKYQLGVLDRTLESFWYTRRASISAIYFAAEFHQLTSLKTALAFLNSLLENAKHAGRAFDEMALSPRTLSRTGLFPHEELRLVAPFTRRLPYSQVHGIDTECCKSHVLHAFVVPSWNFTHLNTLGCRLYRSVLS